MKRLLTLLTAVMLTLLIGSVAMASTMGVNVSKGFGLDFERDLVFSDHDADDWTLRANYAPIDKLLLKLAYTSMDDDDFGDKLAFGLRYQLINNLALVVDYADWNDLDVSKYDIGVRGKLNLGKSVDLVGELTYNDFDNIDYDYLNLLSQVEFKVGEAAVINVGFNYVDDDGSGESDTYGIIGAEWYIKKVTLYFDYYLTDEDTSDSACVGVSFAF